VAVVLRGLPPGVISSTLRSLFLQSYQRADRVVVLSRDMRDHLVGLGIPANRISIIPNWADVRVVHPVKTNNPFRSRHGLDGKFVAMYSGNLGFAQRLDSLLEAMALLCDRPEIILLFVGDGASRRRLEAIAAERQMKNVFFLDYQPKEELAYSLSAADVQLIPLHPGVIPYLMPSKLYSSMASGTAIIATAPEGCELAETITQNEIGILVEPDNPAALAGALRWAADHRSELCAMGERGYRLMLSEFDRPLATGRFAEVLEQLTGQPEQPVVEALQTVETVRSAGAVGA
jgi:colanic acid biosynthesis glycosyl transferase WcaI